jgi:hypothetical protein
VKSEENMSFGGKNCAAFMVLVCVLGVFGAECGGAIVEVQIWGWVTSVEDSSGLLDSPIAIDDEITGIYRYDTDTLDSVASLEVGRYEYDSIPFGITLNIGQSVFRSKAQDAEFIIEVHDGYNQKDGYLITGSNNMPLTNGTEVDQILWQLEYNNTSVLNSDALTATAPSLENWEVNNLRITLGRSSIRGMIDFAQAQVIPEPATAAIMAAGAIMAGLGRKRR